MYFCLSVGKLEKPVSLNIFICISNLLCMVWAKDFNYATSTKFIYDIHKTYKTLFFLEARFKI